MHLFLIAILAFPLISSNLRAVELSTLCPDPNSCTIATPQDEVTNHGTFNSTFANDNKIKIQARVAHFINYGKITNGLSIESHTTGTINTLTNYGEMYGVTGNNGNITVNNLGIIKSAVGNYPRTFTNMASNFVYFNRLTIDY